MPLEERARHDRLMRALEVIPEVAALRNAATPNRRKLVEGLLVGRRASFAFLPALLEATRDEDVFVRDASVVLLHSHFFSAPDMRWGNTIYEGQVMNLITMEALRACASDPKGLAARAGAVSYLRAVYCDRFGVKNRLSAGITPIRPGGVAMSSWEPKGIRHEWSREWRGFLASHAGDFGEENRLEIARILADSMLDDERFFVAGERVSRVEIQFFERGMKSEHVELRRICAKGLGMPASDPSLKGIRQAYNSKLLIKALKNDPDPEVRRLAADGLRVSFRDAESSADLIAALTAGLNDEDAIVRGSSAVAMGMARREARAWLHRKPKHPRPMAGYILADESPVVERLVEMLEDENAITAQRAAWALIFFDGGKVEDYGKRLAELLDHKAESARLHSVKALGNLRMEDALTAIVVPRLVDLMNADGDEMKAAVDDALARYLSWEMAYACNTPYWSEQLDSQDPKARIKAMVRLGFDAERSARASDRIWELFREGGAREKKWALIALQRIDPDGYADAAAEGIRFTDPD